jgi:signal transduction histidine kinase
MPLPTSQERLLACYQQALGHDLPNKLVALQGLARLFGEELAGQLSGESREWLERILGLTREIDTQVRALADVGRACKQMGLATTIDLASLWTEIGAEIACQSRSRTVVFAQATALPAVVLPGRALRRVLLELARYGVGRLPLEQPVRLTLAAELSESDGLQIRLHDDGAIPDPNAMRRDFEPRLNDPQGPVLGLFLARLLVEEWGGTIRPSAPSEGCFVVLEVPPEKLTGPGM